MSKELKPCPFCGGEAEIIDYPLKSDDELFAVICTNNNCLVHPETPYYLGKERACRAWNRRVKE